MEETLGKRIVFHRKRLELTQDQLAEKLGVSAQAVSKWENDQSCPDISALPQLADIFGITVDALLGRTGAEKEDTMPVYEAEVVDTEAENAGKGPEFTFSESKGKTPRFEMSFDSGKKQYIGPAVWVIAVGLFYLANVLFSWQLTFWEVLWPTSLLVFGLFHLIPKFSFLSLGCILVGGYAITSYFLPTPEITDNRIVWAALIVLLGISLLVDGLRKKKKKDTAGSPHINFNGNEKFHKELDVGEDSFRYEAHFGSDRVSIDLPIMRSGEIDVNFGDYTVDLRGVKAVSETCRLEADASFGELTLLVPRRFEVKTRQDTSVAGLSVNGHPYDTPDSILYLDADVDFGSLVIEYI